MKWAFCTALALLIVTLIVQSRNEGFDDSDTEDYKIRIMFMFERYAGGDVLDISKMSPEALDAMFDEFIQIYNVYATKKSIPLISKNDIQTKFPTDWIDDYNTIITE